MSRLSLVCTQTTSQRTLTDLPTIVALQICEYLDAADLVNLCTTVPRWKAFLTRRRFIHVMKQHIRQWTWFDKRLCQLLLPHPLNASIENICEAIMYRSALTKSFHRFRNRLALYRWQQLQLQHHHHHHHQHQKQDDDFVNIDVYPIHVRDYLHNGIERMHRAVLRGALPARFPFHRNLHVH
ncbi:unnamed protein product [Hydatigera taeniaeformis]|uniref:F-box domain-containing protein n=1 Tax=Hydatigena taeniaeformis TaxID=6205 RepID=A0A0R3WY00_HYDTA|nr:unnamed protein product [Hydatigera taeniaeformis]